jgi:carnitine-CoA ligase
MTQEGHTNVPDLLARRAAELPDKVLFDFSGETITYSEFDEQTNRLANGFAAIGVKAGDRVCYMLDNNSDTARVWFALIKLGAIVVPINIAYRGEFLRHQVADAGASIIVIEPDYVERIAAIADTLDVSLLICRGAPPSSVPIRSIRLETVAVDNATRPAVHIDMADRAMLMYTSGTTGPSKGCIISHGYLLNAGKALSEAQALVPHDVYWTSAPMFHMGTLGMAIGVLYTGATISIYPRFSVTGFWPDIERSGATVAILISVMVTLIAYAPDSEGSRRCYGQLRLIQGAPLGPDIQDIFRERFGISHSGTAGFGMTEATPITVNYLTVGSPPGTASGKVYAAFDLEIRDDEGNAVPANTPGVAYAKPLRPHVMMEGYWNNPEATARVMENGWFNTGDIGKLDEDGYFYFLDRAKDYLRRGGENISSFEIESAFRNHPAIADVAVHAVLSDLTEDEVKVTAVLADGATVTEEELCEWSLDQVPSFAVPRYIELRTALPRNEVGRILKYKLRDEGVTPSTWDREQTRLAAVRRRPTSNPARAGLDGAPAPVFVCSNWTGLGQHRSP